MAEIEESTSNPVDLIIERTGMTFEQIGAIAGVSWQSVQQWRNRGSIPPKHVKLLARKTRVARKLLAPEIY